MSLGGFEHGLTTDRVFAYTDDLHLHIGRTERFFFSFFRFRKSGQGINTCLLATHANHLFDKTLYGYRVTNPCDSAARARDDVNNGRRHQGPNPETGESRLRLFGDWIKMAGRSWAHVSRRCLAGLQQKELTDHSALRLGAHSWMRSRMVILDGARRFCAC